MRGAIILEDIMLEIYWGCLIGGFLFGITAFVLGDVIGHAFDGVAHTFSADGFDFLHPMTVVGGVTLFGGIGLMLTKYSSLGSLEIGILSGCGAFVASVLLFFLYVKPMKRTEASMGFSIKELVGKVGEVTIPIPAQGFGEVLIKMGVQHTYQIAASYDDRSIERGVDVVIVEEREGTLYVTEMEVG